MAVDMKKARDFVYANGLLWERALFAFLFEGGDVEHLHRCLLAYKNPDGGYGNALEPDVRCPDSHPLALEFLLSVITRMNVPRGKLFDGTAAWLESVQSEDGFLRNPAALLDFPHAPWWNDGGQTYPDSIVGNLISLGEATDTLKSRTREWVKENQTLEAINAQEWLFLLYHPFDYYMNVQDFEDVEKFRAATVKKIVDMAVSVPQEQYYSLFTFVQSPDSPVAKSMPVEFLTTVLDYLQTTQQMDGSWPDQHGLMHWFPYVTISNLMFLRRFGRI